MCVVGRDEVLQQTDGLEGLAVPQQQTIGLRTHCSTEARIYAPNASGNFLDISYTNHHRVRMSFTERFSHLYVSRGGPAVEPTAPCRRRAREAYGGRAVDMRTCQVTS